MTRLLSALHRLLGAPDHARVSDETLRSIQRDELRQGWAENHVRWHSPARVESHEEGRAAEDAEDRMKRLASLLTAIGVVGLVLLVIGSRWLERKTFGDDL